MKRLEQIWKVLDRIAGGLAAAAMGGMVLLIFFQVFFRYVLKSPLSWSEELARYLFVWAAFLGSVVAARRGQHIGVELLAAKLRGRIKKTVCLITNLLTAGFFAVIFWNVMKVWPKLMKQRTPALKLPMAYPYLGLALGCLLMFFCYLCLAFCQFGGKGDKETWE